MAILNNQRVVGKNISNQDESVVYQHPNYALTAMILKNWMR